MFNLKKRAVGNLATAMVLAMAPLQAPASATPTAPATPAPMTQDQLLKEIGRLEIAAVEAKDFEDLKKLYAADVIDFTPSHFLLGFNQLVGNFAVLTPQVDKWQVSIVPGSERIIATQDMAVASNMQVWRSHYKDTGKLAMEMFYRQTDVWQRQPDGTWKIVHAHSSIPVDPITERPLCLHTDGKCPVPNFPHRGMDTAAVQKQNAGYGDIYAQIPAPLPDRK